MLVDGVPVSASLFDFGLFLFHNGRRDAAAGERAVPLPRQARVAPRGAALERGLHPRPGRARDPARLDPGDRPDRDDPRRLRDGRDPVRAARARGRAERRPLGLPVQRHQEAAVVARAGRPGSLAADDDRAVHARLHRAARADLPPPRRARDRRHGRVHPEPPRPRRDRGRAGQGPRRQGARDPATASTARGWLIPDLVPVAMEVFDRVLGDRPNQKERLREDVSVSAAELLDLRVPGGAVTEAGIRANIRVALAYLDSWLRGVGAAAIDNLMEDAATAEISRSQLWHWRTRGVALADGRVFDEALYASIRDEELARLGGRDRRAPVRGGRPARSARPRRRLRRVPDAAGVLAARVGRARPDRGRPAVVDA